MRAQSILGRFAPFCVSLAWLACSSSAPAPSGGNAADAGTPPATPGPSNPTPSDDAGAPASSDASAPTPTPTPKPTPTPPTPTPTPTPTGWKSVVGGLGFFGQTFDDATWAGRSVAPVTLFSVACADNTHGWASGENGFVAHTTDGGQTWSLQTSNLASNLRAINFGWSTRGVVAGDNGALAVTQDAGAHWTAIAPLTGATLHGAAVAPYVNVMLVVGDGGTVLRSADSGLTWARSSIAGAGDLRGVASDAWAGTVLAVDSLGGIWSSADSGLTFAREAAAGVALDGVSTTQAGTRALAVGAGGAVLLRGPTGGWTPLATGNATDLHAALVTDGGGRLYVAGERGTLLTSADLGAHWTVMPLGTTSALYGLQDL
jgi:photosystem II stability/assembly factor-like uncharacterized protein